VRFRAVGAVPPLEPAAAPASSGSATSATLPAPPVVVPGEFGAGAYTPLLEWACRATLADAAFLMDPHGLVVATVGSLATEEAEAYGARLMVALAHARAMDASGEQGATIAVEAADRVLTAFSATASDGIPFTVGLAGSTHVSRPVRDALRKALGGT
jgi:hypothetical protein